MNDKLGSYITKLMTTIVDKEQEEFVKNQRQMYYDRQYDAKLEAVAEEAQAEAA